MGRIEVEQDEDLAFSTIAAQSVRHRGKVERRLAQRQQRDDEETLRAVKTLDRRVTNLVHAEDAKRANIEQTELLQLEAIMRILERDLRTDVDALEYNDAQRQKYFVKTVSVIVKNENNGRRELTNSERYEWLVLVQKFDQRTLQLRMQEKLAAFKELQKRKIEKFQQTTSTADYRKGARNAAARRRAQGIADGKKQKYTAVLPRTDDKLSPEMISRQLQLVEDRAEDAIVAMMADEESEREVILRGLHRVEAIKGEAERIAFVQQQDGDVRAAERHLRHLEKTEATARAQIVTDERAGFLAIERRLARESVAETRRVIADVTRQVTHQRKIDDRQQRMNFARTHFVERQVLLAQVMRDSPIEQEIFPAFTPRPPEMIAIQQQLMKAPTTPSSRRRRDDALAAELGNAASLHATRASVATRTLVAQMQAARVMLEREERMERFGIITAAQSGGSNNRPADRVAQAHARRVSEQQQREQNVLERIGNEDMRASQTLRRNQETKEQRKALDVAQKSEASKRLQIKTDEDDWWRRFAAYVEAIAGKRIMGAFVTVVTGEAAGRKELAATESRMRKTLMVSEAAHKPQSRVVYVEPLPPPRSKFEITGATARPDPLGCTFGSSKSRTATSNHLPRDNASLSGTMTRSNPGANNNNGNTSAASTTRKAAPPKQQRPAKKASPSATAGGDRRSDGAATTEKSNTTAKGEDDAGATANATASAPPQKDRGNSNIDDADASSGPSPQADPAPVTAAEPATSSKPTDPAPAQSSESRTPTPPSEARSSTSSRPRSAAAADPPSAEQNDGSAEGSTAAEVAPAPPAAATTEEDDEGYGSGDFDDDDA